MSDPEPNENEQPQEEPAEEDEEEIGAGIGLDVIQYLLQARLREAGTNTNEKMVASLKKRGILKSLEVERAFLAVPRGDFLTEDIADEAYQDSPLRFAALGFNISAPHMYSTCLEALQLEEGNSFLDIGSGCGLMTCLAGYMVGPRGRALGLDIRQDIIDFSEANKQKYEAKYGVDLSNTKFETRNCFIADIHGRTWDRIHVGACCPTYKLTDLQKLLTPGGIIVTPYADNLIKMTKDENTLKTTTKTLVAVRYSDLILPSEHEMKLAEIEAQRYRASVVLVPDDSLVNDFASIVNNSKYSDVIFNLKGKLIFAHKFMLAFRCSYLHTLVQSVISNPNVNNTNNNNNNKTNTSTECIEVNIPNVQYDAFVSILKFIYCGETRIDALSVPAVLQAAVDFSLPFVVEKCQSYLQGNIIGPLSISQNLREELSALVNNDRLADVVFVLEGARVFGHRFILSLRSEYFCSIFTMGMKESAQQEITIPEVGKTEFVSVLRFIYTGDVAVVNEENVVDIIEAANYFSEIRLKCVCEDILKRGADIENVAYVLDVATRFEASQLRNACMEFIFKNFEVVSKTKTFADVDRELLVSLLQESCKRLHTSQDILDE